MDDDAIYTPDEALELEWHLVCGMVRLDRRHVAQGKIDQVVELLQGEQRADIEAELNGMKSRATRRNGRGR